MTITFAWTEESIAHLRKRWGENASCSMIGVELGTSRNAVIGKAHRLGLHRDAPRLPRDGAGRRTKEQQDRRVAAAARDPWKQRASLLTPKQVAPKLAPGLKPPTPVRADPLTPGSIALLDLRNDDCRWPSGDTDIRFCGLPRVEREVNDTLCPYCEGHARMAYAPPRTPARVAGAEGHRPPAGSFVSARA